MASFINIALCHALRRLCAPRKEILPLGEYSDTAIAEELGVSHTQVPPVSPRHCRRYDKFSG